MHFPPREKSLLVAVEFNSDRSPFALAIDELKSLSSTAGAKVVGLLRQKRDRPDPKFYIGSGKLEELKALVAATAADLVIFDHELSPAQERNLEQALQTKVIDRTELILDIFAQHARTREGKLQVELAQSTFRLAHLTGHGILMSRLGGGIGTRGPGETKLEYDRRKIKSRISQLKAEIEKIGRERFLKRERRRRNRIPAAVIIGYTNSGKSTLLNALARADVLVENKLFATLDPTMRRLYLPSGRTILLTDTVGFIQKLPHQLIAAFRATLEELKEADLLLHVVDVSHPYFENQIEAVYAVLEELECIAKPMVTIFNKTDLLSSKPPGKLLNKYQPACAVSAQSKAGLPELLKMIEEVLSGL